MLSALVELRATTKTLALAEAFGIARGSRTNQTVVQVELEHDGVVGRGEASAVYYRGESIDAVVDFLSTTAPPLVGDDPFALEDIEERLEDVDGLTGGKAALDGALHDWIGKRLGVPLWRLLGLAPRAPHTSFTIGIDTVEGTRDRVRRAPRVPRAEGQGRRRRGPRAARGRARGGARARRSGWTPTRAGRSTPRASSCPS